MSITAGTKLGRYEIRSKIGESGMGEVYVDTPSTSTAGVEGIKQAFQMFLNAHSDGTHTIEDMICWD